MHILYVYATVNMRKWEKYTFPGECVHSPILLVNISLDLEYQ